MDCGSVANCNFLYCIMLLISCQKSHFIYFGTKETVCYFFIVFFRTLMITTIFAFIEKTFIKIFSGCESIVMPF